MIHFTPTSISVRMFGIWITYSGRIAPWRSFVADCFGGYLGAFWLLWPLWLSGLRGKALEQVFFKIVRSCHNAECRGAMAGIIRDESQGSLILRKRTKKAGREAT